MLASSNEIAVYEEVKQEQQSLKGVNGLKNGVNGKISCRLSVSSYELLVASCQFLVGSAFRLPLLDFSLPPSASSILIVIMLFIELVNCFFRNDL